MLPSAEPRSTVGLVVGSLLEYRTVRDADRRSKDLGWNLGAARISNGSFVFDKVFVPEPGSKDSIQRIR